MALFTPKEVATRIGREYVEADSLPDEESDTCQTLYESIARKIETLYDQIPIPVVFQEDDPYSDYYDMKESVESEGVLRIYSGHADEHKYFSEQQNLEFRAVHDYWGHLHANVDFSPEGEFKKWDHMSQHFSAEQNRVMFAEVVGQVGAVHYLPDGFSDDRYEQRAFAAPIEWIEEMRRAVEN